MINVIKISEIGLEIAKFCRTPKHYTEVANFIYELLDDEDKHVADRLALGAIMEGIVERAFLLDRSGHLVLDPESNSLSDDELEQLRIEIVVDKLLDESPDE